MLNNVYATPRVLLILTALHIAIIAASNYLVQLPIQIFGFESTWGALSFPFIFLVTDLTVRILGQSTARRVVFIAMLPALLISYYFSVVFDGQGNFIGYEGVTQFNLFVFRIVIASFVAYAVGQLLDIFVFNRLRQLRQWWVAPTVSTIFGNSIDSICFFTIAFYQSSDAHMATHWVEIGLVDYGFKLVMSLLFFIPIYGAILSKIQRLIVAKEWQFMPESA